MQEKLIFRLAEKADAEAILEYMLKNFFPEEPCSKALKLDISEIEPIYSALIDRCLDFPFSTVVCKETGEIVAILLNSIWKRDDNDCEGADYEAEEGATENMDKFLKMLNQCHEDFWNLAPSDIHVVLHREISSVSNGYKRRGIATKMLTANMTKDSIKAYGVGGVISETSSHANQLLLEKNGFKCLKEIPYSSILDSQGNQILKTDDGSDGLRLNLKLIEHFKLDN
uniref:aralkylamine N-acetyltransferase n=1 Tax=Caenorhabditis tropicalis TaxID=1561998 RepID=A0A1I7UJD5_9PELO